MIYFISDEHFQHENILKLCNRPFKDVDDMNDSMIRRHNSTVKPNDLVYHIGDFCFGNSNIVKEILPKLNGTHILIQGNHDKCSTSAYLKAGFACVLKEAKIKVGKKVVVMSHYPYRNSFFKYLIDRFIKGHKHTDRHKRGVDKGLILIHGHNHRGIKVSGRSINVAADINNFTPISLNEIQAIIDKMEK